MKNNTLEKFKQELNEANILILQLQAKSNEQEALIQSIYNSKKWKLSLFLSRLANVFFPHNSIRYKIIKNIYFFTKKIFEFFKSNVRHFSINTKNSISGSKINISKFDHESYSTINEVDISYIKNKINRWQNDYKKSLYKTCVVKSCDIIIPIYNAKESIIPCIESVIKNTDLLLHKVHIIDDCSTDDEVEDILNKYSNIKGITIYYNDTNIGFIKTVNRGIGFTNNDVILLNSDTVVTPNWVNKICIAAYSADDIGTATPMTNNGTLVSIPRIGLDNTIPEKFSPDDLNRILENSSSRDYLSIPTGVGFCLFIKRKIIDIVGCFDETYLEKGYCDENDFCNRVIEHGYRNILVDNTFIYHKGTMSFTKKESLRYSEINSQKFLMRYQYYDDIIKNYYNFQSYSGIYSKYREELEYQEYNKESILYLLHNTFDEDYNGLPGGTEYHVSDLVLNNRDQTVHVVVPAYNRNEVLHKVYVAGICKLRCIYPCYRVTHFEIRNREIAAILFGILRDYKIKLVHIQHLIRNTFDIVDLCVNLKIPYVVTLHDTYYLGGNPHLKRVNSKEEHKKYLVENYGINCIDSYINNFKKNVQYMFENAYMIYTPSEVYKKYYTNEYGFEGKIKVIHHGIKEAKYTYNAVWTYPIKVLFIGAFWEHKGSSVIYDILKYYFNDRSFKFYLLGPVGDERILKLTSTNVTLLGSYYRNQLYDKIFNINPHFIINTAYWPESFCYTFSEAAITGIPIISSPEGAIVERAKLYGGTIMTDDKESESFIKILNEIKSDVKGKLWKRLRKERKVYNVKNTEQMVKEYYSDYKYVIDKSEKA